MDIQTHIQTQTGMRYQFAVAMLTAPRPVSTIDESLASLRAAGFVVECVHVFDDCSGHVLPDTNTRTYPRGVRLGALSNFYSALKTIVALEADMFLMLEDDTTWTPGARSLLDKWARAGHWRRTDFGALSLHCMRRMSQALERQHALPCAGEGLLPAGTYRADVGADMWGSQAMLFTRASAQALLALPAFMQASCNGERIDSAIGRGLQLLKLELLYLLPCLARHDLGLRNSSLFGTVGRVIDSPGRQCLY